MIISGSNITVMTGLWSICDDLGMGDLEVRIHRCNLGWYASWDEVNSASWSRRKSFTDCSGWPGAKDAEAFANQFPGGVTEHSQRKEPRQLRTHA